MIRRVLQKLAFNEMLQAVREAEALERGGGAGAAGSGQRWHWPSTQDQIIDQLQAASE